MLNDHLWRLNLSYEAITDWYLVRKTAALAVAGREVGPMYRSIAWLGKLLVSRKLWLNWPGVPIAPVVPVMVVAGFVLAVAFGGIGLHSIFATGIAWGRT